MSGGSVAPIARGRGQYGGRAREWMHPRQARARYGRLALTLAASRLDLSRKRERLSWAPLPWAHVCNPLRRACGTGRISVCGAAKVGKGPSRPWHSTSPATVLPVRQRIEEALAFDDVLLVPGYSQILPSATDTRTRLTRTISLNIPLISAAMDTVTEAPWPSPWRSMAASASSTRTFRPAEQAAQVRQVKKFEFGHGGEPAHHPSRPDAGRRRAR